MSPLFLPVVSVTLAADDTCFAFLIGCARPPDCVCCLHVCGHIGHSGYCGGGGGGGGGWGGSAGGSAGAGGGGHLATSCRADGVHP